VAAESLAQKVVTRGQRLVYKIVKNNMVIKESHFLLRQIKLNDRKELAEIANNKKIWLNLRDKFPHPYSIDDADFYINMKLEEKTQFSFAIEYKDHFVGMIGLLPMNDIYRKTSEIGYWLGEPYWGKGIMTEACKLVTHYGLHTLDFHRLHTDVFEHNIGSMKVLENCGYKKEGIFEKSIIKDEVIYDEHRYAIVK